MGAMGRWEEEFFRLQVGNVGRERCQNGHRIVAGQVGSRTRLASQMTIITETMKPEKTSMHPYSCLDSGQWCISLFHSKTAGLKRKIH